jgi:hypothetical protein
MTRVSMLSRPAFVVLCALFAAACATGYVGDITFKSTQCKPLAGWEAGCLLEFPEFGWLSIGATGPGEDSTHFSIRLTPRSGIEARWSSKEIVIVDLDKRTLVEKRVLETQVVVGGDPTGHYADIRLIQIGNNILTAMGIQHRIERAELRFPPVIVTGGARVSIPPIEYRDGPRRLGIGFRMSS